MTRDLLSRLPTEVIQSCLQYLERADLCAYRLTYRQAESQSFEIVAKRFFSVWKTSLMGTDIRRLDEISRHDGFRKYIKTICIEDDNTKDTVKRWPRKEAQKIDSEAIDIDKLKSVLAKGNLCPNTIQIRDRQKDIINFRVEPVAALAQNICESIRLRIFSLSIRPRRKLVAEATIELYEMQQV